MKSLRQRVVSFLNSIGIKTVRGEVPIRSFLPGIRITKGTIVYNHKVTAADLLHEAAHIAIVPSKYRPLCSGDMDRSMRRIFSKAVKAGEIDPEHPIYRQVIQASESEATAWAWAAGKHIGLPEEQIILDHTYDGKGEEQRTMLAANCHFGINGLRAAGMVESVKTYPALTRWTQP